jgi:hypothetical protein
VSSSLVLEMDLGVNGDRETDADLIEVLVERDAVNDGRS